MRRDEAPVEGLEANVIRPQPGYLTPVAVLVIGMLSIVLLLWTHVTSEQQTNRQFVLDQAIAEVKVTVATSHLWLEEFLTEDPAVDIDARLAELERSDDLMQLLIQGGEIDGEIFAPLRDARLLEQAVAVRARLTEFKNLSAKRRYLGGESAGIGSRLDQEYDEVFFKLLALAEELRGVLEVRWNRQQSHAHMRLWVIIAAWFLVIGAAGAGLWTREQRRRKAEETLRKRELELREAQKMEAVGRLAGGIAHDINNYLGAIRGYCEVAKMKGESGEAVDRRMDDAIETTQNISSLIEQLLAFSRRQPIEPEVVGLNHVVCRLESMMRRLISDDIALETDLDAGAWPIEIDPSQVEQILVNLLVNARDALPRGGTITIATNNVVPDQVDLEKHAVARPGRFTQLSVIDNGIGIAAKVREKIFEPFFTTKQDSSGLGLATVYGIVQQNRGFLVVESELGEGTTFKVLLPSCADELAEARSERVDRETGRTTIGESEDMAGQDAVGAQIFLVEDNKAMRASTRQMLEALGHDVRVAASGEEALRRLVDEDEEVDLVITDVIMPGLSGKELVDRLHDTRPDVRCLFISGYTDQVMIKHGLSEDRVDFLAKPFGASQLAGKISEMLMG